MKALKSFSNGTAPGTSGFRANHFKEAVFCPSPDLANSVLQALTKVINCLCSGKAPLDVVPHLCGAILFASKKKNSDLRPIAVGEVLHRLTSKCVSRAVCGDAVKFLTPLQLGVGVSVGCEAIIHAVTSVQEDPTIQPDDRWTLLLDFSNTLIALVARRCLEKLGLVSQPWLHGWSAVMGPNPFCTSALISSIVAAEFSRETHLVPWVSLLPSILLSRGLSKRCLV